MPVLELDEVIGQGAYDDAPLRPLDFQKVALDLAVRRKRAKLVAAKEKLVTHGRKRNPLADSSQDKIFKCANCFLAIVAELG